MSPRDEGQSTHDERKKKSRRRRQAAANEEDPIDVEIVREEGRPDVDEMEDWIRE